MNKKISTLLIFAFVISLFGCSKKDDKKDDSAATTEQLTEAITTVATTEATTEEVIEEPDYSSMYKLDYAILSELVSQPSLYGVEGLLTCEVMDADDDGFDELYMEKYAESNSPYITSIYAFAPWDVASGYVYTNIAASGDAYLCFSETDNKIYLYNLVAAANVGGESYEIYKNGEWEYVYSYSYLPNDEGTDRVYEYEINGKKVSEDEWKTVVDKLSICKLENDYAAIKNFTVDYPIDIACEMLEHHLNDLECESSSFVIDIDGDGVDEAVFAVNDYCEKWLANLDTSLSLGRETLVGTTACDNVVIFLEESEGKTKMIPWLFDKNKDICDVKFENNQIVIETDYIAYIYDYHSGREPLLTDAGFKTIKLAGNTDSITDMLLSNYFYSQDPQGQYIIKNCFYEDGSVVQVYHERNTEVPGAYLEWPNQFIGMYVVDEANRSVTITTEKGETDVYYFMSDMGLFRTDKFEWYELEEIHPGANVAELWIDTLVPFDDVPSFDDMHYIFLKALQEP